MIICPGCGSVISDGTIIKNVAIIQISPDKTLVNIKCRKCKEWLIRIPVKSLFGG